MTGILKSKKITVLMGGPGSEREVSLRSGAAVARALAGRRGREMDVSRTGVHLPAGTDLAYNMIHGTFGEDGQIQAILDQRGIPYTGEGNAEGSSLSTRFSARKNSMNPVCRRPLACNQLAKSPWSPLRRQGSAQGSSVGVHILKDTSELRRRWRTASASATKCWWRSFSRPGIDDRHPRR